MPVYLSFFLEFCFEESAIKLHELSTNARIITNCKSDNIEKNRGLIMTDYFEGRRKTAKNVFTIAVI